VGSLALALALAFVFSTDAMDPNANVGFVGADAEAEDVFSSTDEMDPNANVGLVVLALLSSFLSLAALAPNENAGTASDVDALSSVFLAPNANPPTA